MATADKLKNMDTEIFWQAVKANDIRFDGAFVLGVKTTGIFCKPSCRARLPKRENVNFYESCGMAESNGFRACLRCRPKEANGTNPQVLTILRACRLIDENEQFSLNELSAELDLSRSHLQRTFKEIIGVSPKKYAEAKQMERFRDGIRVGGDVVTAMYDAGYGSSSRLYEKAAENLGMTPATYKKGGRGMNIRYSIADCELGKILVARTDRGICSVTFGNDPTVMVDGLREEFLNAEIAEDENNLKASVAEILKYLAGKTKRLELPLDLQATAFQMQVWDLLRRIPFGETASYSYIAEQLGDKKKVRAVAQACASNRVAVVIPCHRVIASDGKLSGYRWGIERKKQLLAVEKLKS